MCSFDVVHNRQHTRSVKWDMLESVFQTKDVLPMWVADMDFSAPHAVNEALKKRVEHGIYGYTIVDDAVKQAIVHWISSRHGWEIKPDWLSFSPGVVTSLNIAIQTFTEPGDGVLIQPPVYTPFFNIIEQHGRQIIKNPLIQKNDYYEIDFADFEAKLQQGVKAFMLCSPHNPVGRVWSKEELKEMARLCRKYDVLILADEIHCDLLYPGERHIPIASLSEDIADLTVTFMAPSKTFNLAGLQASYIITSDERKRSKLEKTLKKQGLGMLNTMGNIAMETAYLHGAAWLDEFRNIMQTNKNYVIDMLHSHTDVLRVTRSEGTYLLWIDCSGMQLDAEALETFMIKKAKVGLNPGKSYGEEGKSFMRMNIACPQSTLEEGVKRIITAVNNH
ncbi:MAG TPA: MalY/PatB family protein [Bacillota bacterium]|nr:MalY/PatB family protein [Bacillota bacterium]